MSSSEADAHRLIGHYRLISLLGEGGAAHTWLAEDTRDGQRLAVKELRLIKSGNSKQIELFERECSTLRELNHPQIPRFVDNVVERRPETLSLYLIQELIEGQSLQAILDQGRRFTAREAVQVMQSCLGPLEYLHERNPPLYHRDIKPSNIIQRPDGSCVLVDFGAVREALLDDRSRGSSVVGTFGYMAPEQFQARAYPSTDLYGLAATALHLLSGIEPGRYPLKRLKPEIGEFLHTDPHLTAILDILLEPAAEDRYASVGALRAALDRWIEAHGEDPGSDRLSEITSPALEAALPPPSSPRVQVAPDAGVPSSLSRLNDSPPNGSAPAPEEAQGASAEAPPSNDLHIPVVTARVPFTEMFVPGGLGARELGPVGMVSGLALAAFGLFAAETAVWVALGVLLMTYGLALTLRRRRPVAFHRVAAREGVLADASIRALVRRLSPMGTTEWIAEYEFVADGVHYQSRTRLPTARAAREIASTPALVAVRYAVGDPDDSILAPRH